MSHSMKELNVVLLNQTLFGHKKGDKCLFDDQVLNNLLDVKQRLTQQQYNALIDSPKTLRRLSQIIQQRKQSTMLASNDEWYGSEVMLRAASQADSLPALLTEDELFALSFMRGANQIMMILKINELDARAESIILQSVEIIVRDGNDEILLQGTLNDEGELQGVWPYAEVSPYAHLQASGGKLSIKPFFD